MPGIEQGEDVGAVIFGITVAVEGHERTLEIVVVRGNQRTAILATELDGVLAVDPGEVVESFLGLAYAGALNAVGAGAEVLEDAAHVDFRQSDFTGTHVEAEVGGRILLIGR